MSPSVAGALVGLLIVVVILGAWFVLQARARAQREARDAERHQAATDAAIDDAAAAEHLAVEEAREANRRQSTVDRGNAIAAARKNGGALLVLLAVLGALPARAEPLTGCVPISGDRVLCAGATYDTIIASHDDLLAERDSCRVDLRAAAKKLDASDVRIAALEANTSTTSPAVWVAVGATGATVVILTVVAIVSRALKS